MARKSKNSETKVEVPLSEDRNSPSYWLAWLRAARKGAPARHTRNTRDAYREYLKEFYDSEESEDPGRVGTQNPDAARVYPAYTSAVNTLEPALFSRTPEIVTDRKFDISDDVAKLMTLQAKRLGDYLLENSHFDDVISCAVQDFIHGSKATTQVIYAAKVNKVIKQKPLIPDGVGGYLDGSNLYDGEVKQDPMTGSFFGEYEAEEVDPKSQELRLSPALYDEVLHTPDAKIQADIRDIAYYFCYPKAEAIEKFGEEKLKEYSWKTGPNTNPSDKTQKNKNISTGELFLDGYEIWCKYDKTVRWVSEGIPNQFLMDPKPDPYGLRGFFPSPPFIIQGKPPKNMYPTPMWIHLRPVAEQLHLMYQRVFGLIDAVRRRAIVDGDQDIVDLLNSGNLEFISAKSLKSIVEKGGLNNMIYYLPVQELVQAITELNNQQEIFDAQFDKWAGVPDVIQGLTDPIETLGAQEIKASSAHDRFKNSKKKVQQLARDSIEMMLDLALKVFSDEKIAQITGYQFMSVEDQTIFFEALNLLRDDETRVIRIGIDTDSMTFVDRGLQTQRINAAVTTVTNGLKQASDMLQISPDYATVALQAVLVALDQSDIGRRFSDPVKQAIDGLIKDAEEAKKQPPPPPPPDPAMVKIESDERVAMAKMQQEGELTMQKLNSETSVKMEEINSRTQIAFQQSSDKQQELQVKIMDIQARTQDKQTEIANDSALWAQENQIDSEANQIRREEIAANSQIEAIKTQLKKEVDETNSQIESLRLMLEKNRDDQIAASKLRDDARFEQEQVVEHLKQLHQTQEENKVAVLTALATAQSNQPKTSQSSQPVNVTVQMPKPTKKIGKISADKSGNPIVEIESVEDEDASENESENGVEE